MIFAIIPAAGKSTRMGRPKLSLPLGDKTVLEHVIGVLRQAGVDAVLVVTAPHVPELPPIAERAGACVVRLPDETADMRTTVELGLSRLEQLVHPASSDFWFLVPGDHPSLEPSVVRQLIDACPSYPHDSVFIPVHQGKRGHPALLRWDHVARIRKFPRDLGLNLYLRECRAETREVPTDSITILQDLDTPGDYAKLTQVSPLAS